MNIQSINNEKINDLAIDISKLDKLRFICLTETWFNDNSALNYIIPGFYLSTFYKRNVCKGGGVAIWVKEGTNVLPLDTQKFGCDKHFEICGIQYENIFKERLNILTIYRSPSADLQTFYDKLYEILDSLFHPNVKILVCGDFNIDAYSDNPDYNILTNILSEYNLCNKVLWPTRVTKSTVTTLDHVYTNFNSGISCAVDNIVSDHRTVLFDSTLIDPKVTNGVSSFSRSFNEQSIQQFVNDIFLENWSELYSITDIDNAFKYFHEVIMYYYNMHFPLRKHSKNTNCKSWVNDSIRSSSRQLKDLYILFKNLPEYKEEYLKAKKQHRILVDTTKKLFYQNKILNSGNSTKSLWKVVSGLTKDNCKMSNLSINVDGSVTSNPYVIANSFNTFFKSVPEQIVSQLSSQDESVVNVDANINPNDFFLYPFTEEEFYELMKLKLKNKYSSGPDEIQCFLLRRILNVIVKPVTYLINLSFCSGKFPQILKLGKVVPIYKKGSPVDKTNYRPVTVPYCFSIMFEYCFLNRLLSYLNSKGILSDYQHGFRTNRSTLSAINYFYDKLISYIENGECPIGIFCDLSRAFDCVKHNLLLSKLSEYNINGVPLKWIQSYLSNRSQYVKLFHYKNGLMSSVISKTVNVDLGVPQGSVLGPLLFILYVNDIFKAIPQHISCTMYADDFSLILSHKCQNSLTDICNNLLNDVYKWFCTNSLHLNPSKTLFMHFHNSQKKLEDMNLYLNGNSLPNSKSVTFLGLIIDENLNFKNHCKSIISKLHSIVYIFRNLKNVLNQIQLLSLYYAHVESRMRYGIGFWGWSTLAPNVFQAQKRIVRCMARLHPTQSCKEYFKSFNIMTMPSLFIYELCMYTFHKRDEFTLNMSLHDFNTRHCNDFHVPFRRLKTGCKSPNVLGPKLFNNLPVVIRNAKNVSVFKRNLKEFLIEKCFYSVDDYLNHH